MNNEYIYEKLLKKISNKSKQINQWVQRPDLSSLQICTDVQDLKERIKTIYNNHRTTAHNFIPLENDCWACFQWEDYSDDGNDYEQYLNIAVTDDVDDFGYLNGQILYSSDLLYEDQGVEQDRLKQIAMQMISSTKDEDEDEDED